MKQLTIVQAIKKFFDMTNQECISELKGMSPEDKKELAELACIELDAELKIK